MDLIKFSIENPVKLTVGVILAMLFGTIAYLATPVQLTPDVNEPQITITTLWPGASAQEVEREIIEEQEEQLKSVEAWMSSKAKARTRWARSRCGSPLVPISPMPGHEWPRN